MFVYIFIVFVCLLSYYKEDKKILSFVTLFLLFFFSAFRGEMIGTDTHVYMSYLYRSNFTDFISLSTMGEKSQSYEIISNLLYYFVDEYHLPDRFVIVFFSLLTSISLWFISKRYEVGLPTVMLFFLLSGNYIYSFNIARQITAAMWCVCAYSYVHDDDFKKSLLFFPVQLIAIGLHFSTVIMVLAYAFRYMKIDANRAKYYMLAGITIVVLGVVSIPQLIGFYMGDIASQFASDLSDENQGVSIIGVMRLLLMLCVYFLTLQHIDKKYIPIMIVSLIFSYASIGADTMMSRAYISLSIFSLLYFPLLLKCNDNTFLKIKNIVMAIILVNLVYGYISTISGNPWLVPYYMEF